MANRVGRSEKALLPTKATLNLVYAMQCIMFPSGRTFTRLLDLQKAP